jgi:hypothetical protein
MNQQVRDLLKVTQQNDYTWQAVLPEMPMMWQTGHSEAEAVANWQREYDQPLFAPVFAHLLQQRARHPPLVANASKEQATFQRPQSVDFPYRGKLYRMETNEGLPKRHIVLSNGTILVVCRWNGRVPATLSDIRRSPEPMPAHRIAEQLDAHEAFEIPLQPGQTTKAMAILDFQGQRYAIDHDSAALIKMPDGRLYRVQTTSGGEEPVRIAEIVQVSPTDPKIVSRLEQWGMTPAILMPPDYSGMAHQPRDLRIRFRHQGERYILSNEAYENRIWTIYIPDHGYFRIGMYLESMPVQLADIQPLTGTPAASEKVAVALRLADAVDAEPWMPDDR